MIRKVTGSDQTMAAPLASACSPSRLGAAAVEDALHELGLEEVGVGEEADQQRADEPADEVDADDVEGVVVADLVLQLDGVAAHHTGDAHRSTSGAGPDTKPQAGVIATRPATMPEAAPRFVG